MSSSPANPDDATLEGARSAGRPVVLVTGASRGIGLAVVAEVLSRQAAATGEECPPDWVVAAVASSPVELVDPSLQALLAQHGGGSGEGRLHYWSADLAVPGAGAALLARCAAHYGWSAEEGEPTPRPQQYHLYAILHVAGVLELADVAHASLHRSLAVNLVAGMECVQAALRHPATRSTLRAVVMVSSGASTAAYQGWSSYCISKAALNMAVQCLGLECPGVVSVALRPGVVGTRMQEQLAQPTARAVMHPEQHARFAALREGGALLAPGDPARAMARLLHGVWLRDPAILALRGRYVSWEAIPPVP